ncbi:MlaD family protein [Nocardia camponoti]|uniref:MCE family protein n=1 Tax=Nocardia camponoti TaxID=1616106 RepID=A0A917QKJ9_9NOCA|nr:MlaD family protein [Nocardia camponoti]GGK54291.1 putative MCE family protein [Nocardia camponoti]
MNKLKSFFTSKILVANCALILVFFVGASYLAVNVMRFNPFQREYDVTILLDRSGGLQPGNDVTLRGFRIGQVTSIDLIDQGQAISAKTRLDKNYKIPVDTQIVVQALSAAGEQYIDFRPRADKGPFLANGQTVKFDPEQIKTPVPVSAVLDNTSSLIAQVNPAEFKTILSELDIALGAGPDQLRALINGVSLAVAGLDGLLPQTQNLIANLRVLAETTSHAQPDLGTLTSNSGALLTQFNNANAELQTILDSAPGQFNELSVALDKTAGPISSLAANFVAITKAATLRQPALRVLFPSLRDGFTAMAIPAHDNEFHAVLDIWPRPTCHYDTKYYRNEEIQRGPIPAWNYCTNPPPDQQIRGSANAPRPDVPNNGAFMPPGVDPHAETLSPN